MKISKKQPITKNTKSLRHQVVFKKKVVQLYLSGLMDAHQIWNKYHISKKELSKWRLWYFHYFEITQTPRKYGRRKISPYAHSAIRARAENHKPATKRKKYSGDWAAIYDRFSRETLPDSNKKKHWHEVITELKEQFPIASLAMLCKFFGKTRQAWYKANQKREFADMKALLIVEQVEHIRKYLPKIGGRKLFFMLESFFKKHRFKIGRDKFFDLLRDHDLLIKKKRKRARTTYFNHLYKKHPNRTHQLLISSADRVWISDITYIRIGKGFAYLSLTTDAYSRKIVGYCLSPTLNAEGSIKALRMALKQRQDSTKSLIHHSDRGIQYCCTSYVSILKKNNIKVSMTQHGDPRENALAERIHKTIKEEFLNYRIHLSFETALTSIRRTIKIYNEMRPHASIDYLTPSQAHHRTGLLKRRWKAYYRTDQRLKIIELNVKNSPKSRA